MDEVFFDPVDDYNDNDDYLTPEGLVDLDGLNQKREKLVMDLSKDITEFKENERSFLPIMRKYLRDEKNPLNENLKEIQEGNLPMKALILRESECRRMMMQMTLNDGLLRRYTDLKTYDPEMVERFVYLINSHNIALALPPRAKTIREEVKLLQADINIKHKLGLDEDGLLTEEFLSKYIGYLWILP